MLFVLFWSSRVYCNFTWFINSLLGLINKTKGIFKYSILKTHYRHKLFVDQCYKFQFDNREYLTIFDRGRTVTRVQYHSITVGSYWLHPLPTLISMRKRLSGNADYLNWNSRENPKDNYVNVPVTSAMVLWTLELRCIISLFL